MTEIATFGARSWWSGDDHSAPESSRGSKPHGRAILFVGLTFIVTLVGLVLMR